MKAADHSTPHPNVDRKGSHQGIQERRADARRAEECIVRRSTRFLHSNRGTFGQREDDFCLGLLAGLDRPTFGTVVLEDVDLSSLDENARARLRGEKVGFVFQTFQLIPTLTALENVQVPLELRGTAGAEERATELPRPGRSLGACPSFPDAALRRRAAARRHRPRIRQLAESSLRR